MFKVLKHFYVQLTFLIITKESQNDPFLGLNFVKLHHNSF